MSHLSKSFSGKGFGEVTGDLASAGWALGLVVEINNDLSVLFVSSTGSGKGDDVEEFHISLFLLINNDNLIFYLFKNHEYFVFQS